MIRTIKMLFCDNEHGYGDVTFPDARAIDPETVLAAAGATAKGLRKEARKEGWRRMQGADYCPDCAESEEQ